MPYIRSININTSKSHPFPYDIYAIKYARNIALSNQITFFIGDNGTGKSTLLETLAFRLQLPKMDGAAYPKRSYEAAMKLSAELELEFAIDNPRGFFFRAEDFGNYQQSVQQTDFSLHSQLKSLEGEVPDHILQEMKDNANYQIHHMRKNFGQELTMFSHGEAYLRIIEEKVNKPGIYLLDEPEAALSPARQLSLIYQIFGHLSTHRSQFVIATHSPIIMAMPNAKIFEISENGMVETKLEDTEHYQVTRGFLNNPEAYLRHLM